MRPLKQALKLDLWYAVLCCCSPFTAVMKLMTPLSAQASHGEPRAFGNAAGMGQMLL